MKEIMLGVFHTYYWYRAEKDNTNWKSYCYWYGDEPGKLMSRHEWLNSVGITNIVALVVSRCDKVHFLLDDLWIPFSDKSTTCQELKIVLQPEFIGKVQFWIRNHKVPTAEVVDIIRKGEHFQFNNLPYWLQTTTNDRARVSETIG